MDIGILTLFGKTPAALPLYTALEERILSAFPNTKIKVGKTQVSFSGRYGFAYISPPLRRSKRWPDVCVILTFGLGCRKEHPRIIEAVEPYPNRWTHHVVIAGLSDIDDEVMGWIAESHAFSQVK